MSCKRNNQVTGNAGMYYVCYRLSDRGLNVMPTARNARGIDILAYDEHGGFVTIQVKTLSKRSPVILGSDLSNVMGDYWCIVVKQKGGNPKVFVMTPDEVKSLRRTSKDKNGKDCHWLQPTEFDRTEFLEKWDRIVVLPRRHEG